MTTDPELLRRLREINALASFNRWLGVEVVHAAPGEADLALHRNAEHGQYVDLLHLGIVAALLDTSAGFAAATQVNSVLASHLSMDCLAAATGADFLAKGRVVKGGRRQIFATAELHKTGAETGLVATASVLLVPA